MSNDILTPRDYQRECINAVAAAKFRDVQRPAVVLPTGAGKTVVFAHLAKLFREAFPARKVVVIAHTDELVSQAARKIKAVAPHLKVGIVKADRHDVWADVIVASVQSLCRPKRLADVRGVGLIVIDECHHAAAVSYKTILRHYGALPHEDEDQKGNGPSDVFVVGFTATLARADRKALGEVWQEVVFERDIVWMIDKGHLVKPSGISVEVPDLDLRTVRRQGGDYQQKALASAVVKSMAPEIVAKKYREHAADRPGILFWPSVEAAYLGAEAMTAAGFTCGVVEGSMPADERRHVLAQAQTGELQTLSSCMVLTEGFDNPRMSCAVIARPTESPMLYQQMVGRVLRPHPESGKTDARILDVVGAGKQHTLDALIDLEDKTKVVKRDDADELGDETREAGASGGAGPVALQPYSGETVSLEFDPLARSSKRVWNDTEGTGTRFLVGGSEYYVFVAPGVLEGNWTVMWCRKIPATGFGADQSQNSGVTEHAEIPLETAMSWAEQLVSENFGGEHDYNYRNANWRNGPPMASVVKSARAMGFKVSRLDSAGKVSDLINRRMASKRIDPIVKSLTRRSVDA